MPRGYRCIILAAVGWLILCAQHPNPATRPEQAQTDSRVGDALTNIASTYHQQAERAERAPESPPCGPNQYDSHDDLCAQWKAADAAEVAAFWARFSGALSVAGLLGVAAALYLTIKSNQLARQSMHVDNRAWLNLSVTLGKGSFTWKGDTSCVSVVLFSKNLGKTPALNASLIADIYCGTDLPAAMQRFAERMKNSRNSGFIPENVFPDQGYEHIMSYEFARDENPVESSGMVIPAIIACVKYKTLFDGSGDPMRITLRAYELTHYGSALLEIQCPIPTDELQLRGSMQHPGYVE